MKKTKLLTTAALLSIVLLGSNTLTAAAAPADAGRQCSTYNRFVYYYILKNLTQLPCPPVQLPDTDLPDCNLPGTDLPDNNLPGDNTPDTDLPDSNLPGDNTPGTDSPDSNLPGDNTPGTDSPDSNLPGDNTPGTDSPDSNLPGDNTPGTDLPDSNLPGDNTPDTDSPDSNLPGGNAPDTDLPDSSTPGTEALSYTAQVVKLVNAERAKEGLSPLTVDTSVQAAAQVRAVEIQTSFSHTRPNGSSFSTALKEQNVSYRSAGENIAWGQRSPQEVVTAWMNSAGHRANIMNANFTKIGVGYYQNSNGTKYWSQLFIQ